MDHDLNDDATGTPEARWLPRLHRLADDVELGLSTRATANAIRDVAADMLEEQHRASVLSNICGAER
jgi:hypothetical protein